MNKTEITALAQRAQAGDKAAFEALYNEFSDKVYFFAKRNVGSSEAARDITSDTFVTALEDIDKLRSGESFIGWLYSIAYNKCVKYNNDSSHTEHFDDDTQLENAVNEKALNEPVMLPEDYVTNVETREQLKSVIDRLPADQRSAVILYYYDDMSVPEVAKALGTNEHNASQKLYAARKRIRKGLEKLFGKGGMLAAVPMGALLNNTVDPSYAHAAAGAARVAGKSFAVKLIGFGTAAAVAVGVPIALHNLSEKNGGDYRPEDSSQAEQPVPEPNELPEVIVWHEVTEHDPRDFSGTMTLDAFPNVEFKWENNLITVTDNGKVIDDTDSDPDHVLSGMPIWNAYFTDLNADSYPELCMSVSYGSGIIDEHIIVYDHRNRKYYTLWDRGKNDYLLTAGNGKLIAGKYSYDNWTESSTLKFIIEDGQKGTIAIEGGELVFRPFDETDNTKEPQPMVTQNEHFKMTFAPREINNNELYCTVKLEGVDALGKDYIKNSQAVRDHLSSSKASDTSKNDLYEPLFPTMYTEDENGERHYFSGNDLSLSETVCTALYKIFCPADAHSLKLHILTLDSVDNWSAHRYDGMDITLDLTGVSRK